MFFFIHLCISQLQFNTTHSELLPLLEKSKKTIEKYVNLPKILVGVKILNNTNSEIRCIPRYVNTRFKDINVKTTGAQYKLYPDLKQSSKTDMEFEISSNVLTKKFKNIITGQLLHCLGISTSILESYWGVASPGPAVGLITNTTKLFFDLPTVYDTFMYKNAENLFKSFWIPISDVCMKLPSNADYKSEANSYLRIHSLDTFDMRITNRDVYTVFDVPIFVFRFYSGFTANSSFQHLNEGIMSPISNSSKLTKDDPVFNILCGLGYDIKDRHGYCTEYKPELTEFVENCKTEVELGNAKAYSSEDQKDPRNGLYWLIFSLLIMLLGFSGYCLYRLYIFQKAAIKRKRAKIDLIV